MFTLLLTLILLVAVLLTIIILVQNAKQGGGLSQQFGGSSATQLIGVQKTTDTLEKMTWWLVGLLFILAISLTILLKKGQQARHLQSPNIESVKDLATVPVTEESSQTSGPSASTPTTEKQASTTVKTSTTEDSKPKPRSVQ